jgi:hypothetical protein
VNCKDGAQDRNAERGADHARRVDQARGGAGTRRPQPCYRHCIDRTGIEAKPNANQEQGGFDQDHARCARYQRQEQQAGAHEAHAAHYHGARPDSLNQRARTLRDEDEGHGQRQQFQAGSETLKAIDALRPKLRRVFAMGHLASSLVQFKFRMTEY